MAHGDGFAGEQVSLSAEFGGHGGSLEVFDKKSGKKGLGRNDRHGVAGLDLVTKSTTDLQGRQVADWEFAARRLNIERRRYWT